MVPKVFSVFYQQPRKMNKKNQHHEGNPDQNFHCLFQLLWKFDWEHRKIKTRTTSFDLDWEHRKINMESRLGTHTTSRYSSTRKIHREKSANLDHAPNWSFSRGWPTRPPTPQILEAGLPRRGMVGSQDRFPFARCYSRPTPGVRWSLPRWAPRHSWAHDGGSKHKPKKLTFLWMKGGSVDRGPCTKNTWELYREYSRIQIEQNELKKIQTTD